MLRINQIVCPIEYTKEQIFQALCRKCRCRESDILSWKIAKRSLDARKKPQLFYSYVLLADCKNEKGILTACKNDRDVIKDDAPEFHFEVTGQKELAKRPVIVGTGPAGLFCALELAKAGFRPILLERGKDVERRCEDVEAFWNGKALQENSNVQFGEGGAGTFSDGKLNTLVKDKYGRNIHVLETFVAFGAKESILYDQKPHLGTDALKDIVKNMREKIVSLGGEVRFESRLTDIRLSALEELSDDAEFADIDVFSDAGKFSGTDGFLDAGKTSRRIAAVEINGAQWLETEALVLAIGHSARDTLAMLYDRGLTMEAKPFAVGFRVQHPQDFINQSQYGTKDSQVVGAASYKLTAKAKDGRGVYSFCMCPGGYVVDASSEAEALAVNGMSYSGRDGECANSAVIVAVTPKDFQGEDSPLAGIFFQRELEKRAYQAGDGKIPIQKYGDFQEELVKRGILKKVSSADEIAPFAPAIKGRHTKADLADILPAVLNKAFTEGMEEMNRKIRGFASKEVWLCGIESRTSSPVRICRDESLQSNIRGIYPCGEGAGYAGGITSAAMDGIRAAQAIAAVYHGIRNQGKD